MQVTLVWYFQGIGFSLCPTLAQASKASRVEFVGPGGTTFEPFLGGPGLFVPERRVRFPLQTAQRRCRSCFAMAAGMVFAVGQGQVGPWQWPEGIATICPAFSSILFKSKRQPVHVAKHFLRIHWREVLFLEGLVQG